jgi:hypothetical protein
MKDILGIFMDTCAFYPPQKEEKLAANEIFKLYDKYWDDGLLIGISDSVEKELSRIRHRMTKRVFDCICTLCLPPKPDEIKTQDKIRDLIFIDKKLLKRNDRADINNIFEAQKYGYSYFVTTDRAHILSKADKLEEMFRIKALLPSECLKELRQWIVSDSSD